MKTILILLTAAAVILCAGAQDAVFFQRKKESPTGSPVPEILWWKFNEGSGTSVTTPAGTATSPTWATGLSGSGSCIDFNGSTTKVDSDAAIDIGGTQATICFVANADFTNVNDYIIQLGPDAGVNTITINNNAPHFTAAFYGTNGVRSERVTGILEVGVSHSYIFTFDGSTGTGDIKIYVDGVERVTNVNNNTRSGTANITNHFIRVGAHAGGSFLYDGRLDDVRVYNRVITDAEAVQISADRQ